MLGKQRKNFIVNGKVGGLYLKIIKMILGEKEIARIIDGKFVNIVVCNHPFAPNFQKWYEDCFYGIENAQSFEVRFEFVKIGQYFCYSKPSLKLMAEEV